MSWKSTDLVFHFTGDSPKGIQPAPSLTLSTPTGESCGQTIQAPLLLLCRTRTVCAMSNYVFCKVNEKLKVWVNLENWGKRV